jgi:hypothetical protein
MTVLLNVGVFTCYRPCGDQIKFCNVWLASLIAALTALSNAGLATNVDSSTGDIHLVAAPATTIAAVAMAI